MADAPSKSQLAEQFMANFNHQKTKLTNSIEVLSQKNCSSENANEILTNISNEIQKLSKTLHDAILFLPSYSVKMRQNEIRDLEMALKTKENDLIPKKKFGFKSTNVTKSSANSLKQTIVEDTPAIAVTQNTDTDANYVTIENLKDTSFVCDEEKLSGCDVLVRDLENVVLHLHGSPSTLRIKNVKNCGPVLTSVFVDSAIECVLFICCQQLRTHSSKNTDIYLRVRSRAIIEDCTSIRFGPYQWEHPKSKDLHDAAQINFDLDRYDAVDDFNWLSATQSPNWTVIPDQERITFPLP